MNFKIRAWKNDPAAGDFTTDDTRPRDALAKAQGLHEQGFENVTITDANGRVFRAPKFRDFVDEYPDE